MIKVIKKIIVFMLVFALMSIIASCHKEMKTLTCDGCGVDVQVEADSNMEEDWLVYCEKCNAEILEDFPELQ